MSQPLKIQIIGSLNVGKSINEINMALRGIEKKINKIKINLEVNDNILKTIQNFNNEMKKLAGVSKDFGKVIQEEILPDGSRVKYTFFNGLNGEFSKIAKAAKESADKQKVYIDEVNQGYEKELNIITRLNAEQKKLGQTTTLSNQNGVNKRKITTNANDEVTSITDTKNTALEEKLTNQLIASKEKLRIKLIELNNIGQVTNSSLARMSTAIDSSKDISQLNRIEQSLKRMDDSSKAKEKTKELERQLSLYQQAAKINADKLLQTHSKTVDQNALKQWVADVNKLNATTPNLNHQMQELQLGFRRIQANASEASRSSMGFVDSLRVAMVKFPIWMTTTTAFYGTIRMFNSFIDTIITVDDKLTSLKKVMDQDTNFDKVMQSATSSAHEFAKSLGDVLDAYAEFAKQGYKADELKQLGDAALVASNVAELSSQQTAGYLTSVLTQWKMNTDEAMKIVDSWNNISNNFGTTTEKLAEGQSKAGATARVMGLDFDQLNAIIGSVTVSTKQSGEVIGDFVKSVLPRLTSKTAQNALKSIGVSIFDNQGNMRQVMDIYTEVANKLKDMDKYNRSIVIEGLAGKYQISRMSAFLDDLASANSLYKNIYKSSVESAGSAERENDTYMKSLTARAQETKLEIQKLALALGNAFLTETFVQAVQGFGSIVSAVTKLVEKVGGLPLIFGLISSSVLLLSKNMRTLATNIIFGTAEMTRMEMVSKSLSISLKTLGAATLIGLASMAIGGITEAILSSVTKARQAQEDFDKKNKEMLDSYKQNKSELTGLIDKYGELEKVISSGKYTNSQLKDYKDTQNKIATLMPSLVTGETEFGDKVLISADNSKLKLQMMERQLQVQLELNAAKDKEDSKKEYDTAKKELEDYTSQQEKSLINLKTNLAEVFREAQSQGIYDLKSSTIKDLNDIEKQLEKFEQKRASLVQANKSGSIDDTTKQRNDIEISLLDKSIKHLKDSYNEYNKFGLEVESAQGKMANSTVALVQANANANNKLSASSKSLASDYAMLVSNVGTDVNTLDKILSDFADSVGNSPTFTKQFTEYGKAIDDYNQAIAKGLNGDALDSYKKKALDTFNSIKTVLVDFAKDRGLKGEDLNKLSAQLSIAANNAVATSTNFDALSKSTGKTAEELQSELLLIPDLSDAMGTLADTSYEAAGGQEQLKTTAEQIAGVSQDQVDSLFSLIGTYEALNGVQSKSEEQQNLLADALQKLQSLYPSLVDGKSANIRAIQKEAESQDILLKALKQVTEGHASAQEVMTTNQAVSAKNRLEIMNAELQALAKMEEAYVHAYNTGVDMLDAEGNATGLVRQGLDETRKAYAAKKIEIDKLIPSVDSLTRKLADQVNYDGKVYKSTSNAKKATESANKSTQSSIYISDKYKKALEAVNLELDKQQSIQNKYSQYSSKYQDSLKKELALLKEKKSILEAQAKDLQKQIKSGNIKQTGLITTSSPSKSSSYASGGSTKDVIWNYFKSKGLSDSAVAGIMGNLQQESGFSTSIVNPSSGATGLAQWLGGRLTNLKSFAKSRGTSYTDLQTQLDFLWKELNGSEKKTLSYLLSNSGSSASTLAAGFERLFERSGGSAVGARQNYANSIYSKYAGSGSVTASSSNSSSNADKQQAIDEAKSNLIDLQSQILDINDQIQQLYLDRVNAKLAQYDHSKDMLQDDYANIDYKMEQVNENSKQWADLQKQKISLMNKEKSYDEQAIKYLKNQIANNKELTAAQRDTLKDDLVKRTTDLLNLEKDIMNVRLQMADKVMDTYKQVLEQQKQAALDTIDDMINEIDKKSQEDQYKKDLANKQKSAQDIQSQIDELALDDSDAAKKKRLELQQQLQQQQQEIQDTMNQHNTDLRKQNLEAQKDEITKHYDDILNDETAMAKMRSDIVKGNTKDIAKQLTDFYSFIKTNTKNLGNAISNNLLTLLDQASVIIPGVKKPSNLPKHHDGGIVGSTPSTNNRLTEIANKLFNVKPGEQVVKSLVGELQVPPKNIPNLFTNVNNLVNFLTQRQTPILAGNTYHLTLQVENLNGTKKDAEFILSKVVNGVKSMGGKI
ncbi:phage tail tape measure protein [Heyndrickxia camelliae]|uniref:Phage tail tape measure protein n=1 Tax=Heyndrickxia camelliae TaxID=1707093 RepID=A0A2N3LDG4_9BACI|nr:phage tail tape measure protein [Heyndrickxia camelliae]PKR82603.1 phage tail tape measure protein [Heyndrickxia camelliae]